MTLALGIYAYVYSPVKMKKAYRQSLMALARAVETKDAGSEGHGERVASYCVAVAREMNLSNREIDKIEYAAFLQDLGNVRVSHSILNKAGSLTLEEFETLKQHTLMGAEIVSQVKFLKPIAPIIRHHHEGWDGSGYPDGLKGTDIPLGSRILAVCTAYDSMVHARAYRGQMDETSAIQEIQAYSGRKYDPDVVKTFLKVLKVRQRIEEET